MANVPPNMAPPQGYGAQGNAPTAPPNFQPNQPQGYGAQGMALPAPPNFQPDQPQGYGAQGMALTAQPNFQPGQPQGSFYPRPPPAQPPYHGTIPEPRNPEPVAERTAPSPSNPNPSQPAYHAPPPSNLGHKPVVISCSQCNHRGPTTVSSDNCTAVNWVLTLFCCLCCFFLVPATAKHSHTCSKCGGFIGSNNMV